MSAPHDLHNQIAGPIVASIINPIVENGGDATQILVLLESVCVGTMFVVVKLGGAEPVVETFMAGVKRRLSDIQLQSASTGGTA